jgi:hypothetical protein
MKNEAQDAELRNPLRETNIGLKGWRGPNDTAE